MLFAARLQGEDGAVVAHLDITARRQTEDELRRTQGLLQSILDHTPALVFVKDLEQRYLLVNRRCEEVFGVSSDSIRGKTAAEVFPAEMAQQFAENDNRTLMGDAPHLVEETVPTPDGPMVVASTQFPIRGRRRTSGCDRRHFDRHHGAKGGRRAAANTGARAEPPHEEPARGGSVGREEHLPARSQRARSV